MSPYIDVRRDVALHARVVVHQPRSANVVSGLENGVFYNILHVWESVLELMRHEQAREASADSKDFELAWGVGVLARQAERVVIHVLSIALWGCRIICDVPSGLWHL